MFEYKLLPVPAPAKKAKGRKTVPERFTHALGEVLNEQAKDGWEFSGQETFPLEEKTGLRRKETQIELRTLIFRREIGLNAMPLDKKLEKLRKRKAETIVQAVPVAPPTPFPAPMPPPEPIAPEPVVAAKLTPESIPESTPEPVAEPFPAPMTSPQAMAETTVANGAEPTRIFSPFGADDEPSDAPALGPAKKD